MEILIHWDFPTWDFFGWCSQKRVLRSMGLTRSSGSDFFLKDFLNLSFFSTWCKQILADISKKDLHFFEEVLWKLCQLRILQISQIFPTSELLLANFFRTTVYVYKKAELKMFVDLKFIRDSGERLSLVLSIAFTDVEGEIVSQNKLFDNFKKNFLLNLDRQIWLLFSKLSFTRAETLVIRRSLAKLRKIQEDERNLLLLCPQNCFHRRSV